MIVHDGITGARARTLRAMAQSAMTFSGGFTLVA
jgi:hypothetical protein